MHYPKQTLENEKEIKCFNTMHFLIAVFVKSESPYTDVQI